jgi:hypothetical protein
VYDLNANRIKSSETYAPLGVTLDSTTYTYVEDVTMNNASELVENADYKLEHEDFVGAVEDYRSAALLAEPSKYILSNLNIAEELEQLAFRQKLVKMYPTSIEVQLVEAGHLAKTHYGAGAINLYSEILGQIDKKSVLDLLLIRRIKFAEMCHSWRFVKGHQHQISQELQILWLQAEIYKRAAQFRRNLLRTLITELNEPEHVDLFKNLSQDETYPETVKGFFKAKINELRALGIIDHDLGIAHDG